MSLTVQPHRARCIQVTDGTVICPCPWFNAPSLPSLDQFSCVDCGHGIHAHVDYVSKIVHHRPANYCAAYAQKTHKSQACTCAVQLFDHEAIVNVYRSLALSHSPAFIPSSLDSVTSLNANIIGPSGDTGTLEVTLTSTPVPSINATPSSASNSMLFSPDPVPFYTNGIPYFSQSDAYASVYYQRLDDASLVQNLAGSPVIHHAPGDHYDYVGMDGAPSTEPYTYATAPDISTRLYPSTTASELT